MMENSGEMTFEELVQYTKVPELDLRRILDRMLILEMISCKYTSSTKEWKYKKKET